MKPDQPQPTEATEATKLVNARVPESVHKKLRITSIQDEVHTQDLAGTLIIEALVARAAKNADS